MSARADRRMTADEFFTWHERQERRHELIDGVPVAMAGAKRRHDQVVVNATILIGSQIGTGPCRAFSADTAVRIPRGNVRYPDLGVDRGRFLDEGMEADAPTLVVEVLSESNRAFDVLAKLEEYKSVPALRHIILVNTDAPDILHWSRPEGGTWTSAILTGLSADLSVPDLGLTVPLRAVYAGLEFRPKPQLVDG
jgi:Uma2 family endonuclease